MKTKILLQLGREGGGGCGLGGVGGLLCDDCETIEISLQRSSPLPAYFHDRIVECCTGRWFIMIFFHSDFHTVLFHCFLHISTATTLSENFVDFL